VLKSLTGARNHEDIRAQYPEGTVKEVKKGATTSHVLIDVKGLTVTASITNESVEALGLKAGLKVKAVIKSSDVHGRR